MSVAALRLTYFAYKPLVVIEKINKRLQTDAFAQFRQSNTIFVSHNSNYLKHAAENDFFHYAK